MIKRSLTLTLAAAMILPAHAQEEALAPVVERFKAMYPKTTFQEVRRSPVSGLYEVVMGENVAYTDASGRYFIFGHLFDMQEQKDLTAQRLRDGKKTDFPSEHLANAIKTVRGNGSRVLAVFSDPDCPYCRTLEAALARLDNVTLYTFLYPLESLHPEARTKAISIWCASEKNRVWNQLMLAGNDPKPATCNHPVDDNLVLGSRLGVVGTPTLIAADGRVLPGAASAEELDTWLDAGRPVPVPGREENK